MFSFSKLSILSVGLAVGTSNAFISGVKPFEAGYMFKPTPPQTGRPMATLPVVFTTASSKMSLHDVSVTFGITALTTSGPEGNTTFGKALEYTVDLAALGFSDTGPGEFTIEVPLLQDKIYDGVGIYDVVAAVTRAVGNVPNTTFRLDQFKANFEVVTQ